MAQTNLLLSLEEGALQYERHVWLIVPISWNCCPMYINMGPVLCNIRALYHRVKLSRIDIRTIQPVPKRAGSQYGELVKQKIENILVIDIKWYPTHKMGESFTYHNYLQVGWDSLLVLVMK